MATTRQDTTTRSWIPMLATFSLLVVIGAAGRWNQPDWAVTPIAAVGLLAGYSFRSLGLAMLVPLGAMILSDLALEPYGSIVVQATVYGSLALAAPIGRLLRPRMASLPASVARAVGCAALPSILFFLATNFAVWLGGSYGYTLTGLAACYSAAIPFFRLMLTGDMVFSGLLFSAAALAGVYSLRGLPRSKNATIVAA